jgi:hypothetical protein
MAYITCVWEPVLRSNRGVERTSSGVDQMDFTCQALTLLTMTDEPVTNAVKPASLRARSYAGMVSTEHIEHGSCKAG